MRKLFFILFISLCFLTTKAQNIVFTSNSANGSASAAKTNSPSNVFQNRYDVWYLTLDTFISHSKFIIHDSIVTSQMTGSVIDIVWYDSNKMMHKTSMDCVIVKTHLLDSISNRYTKAQSDARYYSITNPSNYISSVPAQSFASLTGKATTLSGYGITDAYPLAGNPSGFLAGITSGNVTTALGYTPINPNGSSSQYFLGDGTLATKITNNNQLTNGNNYLSVVSWSIITSKPTFATVATSGDYNDLSNKPTIPTVSGASGTYGLVTTSNGLVSSGKRVETYSGTSNGSGVYTVTFGTAYSVAPNIQCSITNQSATNQYLRVTSVSTTGFTINAFSFVTNTLLGIVNLTSTTSNLNGATIDVLITEK